jgi:NAD(P)-dependent dehydrogenase (short-subunit alcohol dehydrogenase family)
MFAEHGADIVAVARGEAGLAEVQREVEALGRSCALRRADLAKLADLERLAAEAEALAVDILVNNAGVSEPKPALETTLGTWERTFAVNVRAAFVLTQAFGQLMLARGWGRVINISSQAGLVALEHHVAYCASKGALELMSRVLALEWAPCGVTVNCVAPTVIATPMAEGAFPTPEAKARMLRRPLSRLGGRRDDYGGDAKGRRWVDGAVRAGTGARGRGDVALAA